MPKQGQFAASRRRKKIKQFKVKRHDSGQMIDPEQLVDFVLVRFALTTKRRIAKDHQESEQRFLQELVPAIREQQGDVRKAISKLLPQIRTRVPWQFFRQVASDWPLVAHFIKRELPAIPVKDRFVVFNLPDEGQFNQLVGNALAEQAAALTMLNIKLPAVMRQQIARSIKDSVVGNGQVDWRRVAQLFKPIPFDSSSAPDMATRQWLDDLQKTN